jgi:hypothetical protein
MSMEQEVRKTIEEFPRYEITNLGRVFNKDTGREMVLSHNQYGIITVSMMKDVPTHIGEYVSNGHIQRTRSVKSLVAKAFVPGESDKFNTPILLDGDKTNLRASNMAWRPRWFAVRYTRQFYTVEDWYFHGPIVDVTNHIQYDSYFDAATANGLLCKDIRLSIFNNKRVFPTGDQYRFPSTR